MLLRSLRQRATLSQSELAVKSGVAVVTIAQIERGEILAPWPRTLRKLAVALGVPSSVLSTREEQSPPVIIGTAEIIITAPSMAGSGQVVLDELSQVIAELESARQRLAERPAPLSAPTVRVVKRETERMRISAHRLVAAGVGGNGG